MRPYAIPAMTNVHSHAFQRDLRGRGERTGRPDDDFWSWREGMYELAGLLDPDGMREVAERVYREMAAAGYGVVGEFHYVHHRPDGTPYEDANAMAVAVAEAAAAAGLKLRGLASSELPGPKGNRETFVWCGGGEPVADLEAAVLAAEGDE